MKKQMAFVTVMIIAIIVLVFATLIFFSKEASAIPATMLAFLELGFGLWVLYLYIRYRAQHKFIFEDFSSELLKPINLRDSALEELTSQFQSIRNQLHLYPQLTNQPQDHQGARNWLKRFRKESTDPPTK